MGNGTSVEVQKTQSKDQKMEYLAAGEKVTLSPNMVRNYLVSGNKDNVSLEEVVVFMNLCRYQHLNPWLKEAYLIKYGQDPATMVVSKEAFQKRAEMNPAYDGSDAGIIVMKANGDIEYRKGMLYLEEEKIVGGYAEVWRKDRSHSTRIEVTFNEYAGRKRDGSLNSQWSKKPATMIRKVALAQALRDAFPGDFGGMYTAEEQGYTEKEGSGIEAAPKESAADVEIEAVDPFEAADSADNEPQDNPVPEEYEEEIDITA